MNRLAIPLLLLPLVACSKPPEGKEAYLRAARLYGEAMGARLRGDYAKAADLRVKSAALSRPEDSADRWYAAACAYALSNQRDDAFRTLAKSIEAGYLDLDNFDRDPDFASLRSDPRMAELRTRLVNNFNTAFPKVNQSLRHRVLELHRDYAALRASFYSGNRSPDLVKQVEAAAASSLSELEKIVAEHGWPGRPLVGEDGAYAALNLLSDSKDLDLQRKLLPMLMAAAQRREIPGDYVAKVVDTLATRDGKSQVYGMQWRRAGGKVVLEPIEDAANVDARRAALGLRPLDEYLAQYE